MTTPKQTPTTTRNAAIARIARDELSIGTLATRNSDRLDFHEVAVWGVRSALVAAYDAGRRSVARPKAKRAPR